MSRIGLFFVGVCVVAFSTAGCAEGSTGGGGSGGGGSGGMGGMAGGGGTGGTGGGIPQPCASEWESPPGMPVASNVCTYDFPSMAPPTRDCLQQEGTRLLFEYDASKPCGMPCVTGRPGGGSAVGTHFDAALLPLAEAQTIVSGDQFTRIEYDVDQFGNEVATRTYDADDQLTGSATTTYDPPAQPTSFEVRIDGNNMLLSSGAMTYDSDGRLATFEQINEVGFNPRSLFTYEYNPDGTFDVVTWLGEDDSPVGTFTFSYTASTATVTFDLADGTPQSVLTFDYVCAP